VKICGLQVMNVISIHHFPFTPMTAHSIGQTKKNLLLHFIMQLNSLPINPKHSYNRFRAEAGPNRNWRQGEFLVILISTSNMVEVRTMLVSMKSMLQGWKCVEMFGFVHISLKLKKHVLKAL